MRKRQIGILLDDEHGRAVLRIQPLEGREELVNDGRRQSERRLVAH